MLKYLFTLIPEIFKSKRGETINPLYLWKYDSEFNISIVKHDCIKKVKIVYVSPKYHKGQSFADVNIYISDKTLKNFGCPHAAIEITKNDSGDSGNMCYQRLENLLNCCESIQVFSSVSTLFTILQKKTSRYQKHGKSQK